MTAYNIVNGTSAALSNVNGASVSVPAYSCLDAVTLTSTELVALVANAGVAVTKTVPTQSQRHWICKVFKLGRNPGA